MAAVERTLTINLRKEIMKVPDYKRAKKAVTAIREFLQRHMKADAKDVKIGKYLNLKIWEHGIKKPAHKITVIAKKDDKGIVTAELPSIPAKKQNEKRLKAKEKQGNKAKTPEQKETKATATQTTATTATAATENKAAAPAEA
ncbi:50S ribosomal protein L31e [Candidatus Woesearchaeota archaeon]|nr:50S ribosomal protein L31e [Candidatus Woesearchaeota archaeon]